MKEIELIRQVYPLLLENKVEREGPHLNVTGSFEPADENIDIFKAFSKAYSENEDCRASFDDVLVGVVAKFSFTLKNISNRKITFYKDSADFFSRIKNENTVKCLEENYCIVQDGVYFKEESWDSGFSKKIDNIKTLINFINALEKLAHHTSGTEDLIFISHKDESDKSIVINKKLNKLPNNLLIGTSYKDFLEDVLEEESYALKVKSIFRSSLVEFFEKTNRPDKLHYLLDNYSEFNDAYSKNYEVFVRGVSLNKIKSELVQEQIKLFDSVNKGMQEVTNRVMLLPGIGFLVMLLRAQEKSYENSIIIVLSLLIVSTVILISVFNQESMLSILKKTHLVSVENLSKLNDSTGKGLSSILSEMKSLADNTENILFYFNIGLWILPFLFVIFMSGMVTAIVYILLYLILYYYVSKGFNKLNS